MVHCSKVDGCSSKTTESTTTWNCLHVPVPCFSVMSLVLDHGIDRDRIRSFRPVLTASTEKTFGVFNYGYGVSAWDTSCFAVLKC